MWSTQAEEGTRPFGPLKPSRPAPRSWPLVEGSRPIKSNGEQDKLDVTHIHGRANENTETNDCTELMASESPRVERKPNDGEKQAPILVDSGALGNYFDD